MPENEITNNEAIKELQWLADSYKKLIDEDNTFKNCITIMKACELGIRALNVCEDLGWLNSETEVDEDED